MPGFVYVAGPYRGKDALAHDWTVYCEIDAHINDARRWAAQLATDGIPFFCPHLNSAHMEVIAPSAPSDYWLKMDLEILQYAWGVLLVPGWRDSNGARAEKDFALERGIKVFTYSFYDRMKEDYNAQAGN